jgi:hypothetical protein
MTIGLLLPLASAYAESFSVTTNKDLYTIEEKAIIVGIVPDTAPEGYAVLLRVAGSGDSECSVQNILPDSDGSFVSRPVDLDECGTGQFVIMAYYAEFSANSTFTVSNSSQTGQGNRLELRLLKNVAVQSQETVNQRLREFLESSQVLPEDIADKYSLGVFEASLVLQAVDYGDTAEAKKHLIVAVKQFRQVIDSLAKERMIFEQAIALDASSDETAEVVVERYQRVKEFYFRLEEVAQKNGVDNESEFETIVTLLAKSKHLIDEGNLEEANRDLEEANAMLESVRSSLYGNDELEATTENATMIAPDPQAKKLASVADKFEKTAVSILNDSPSEQVNATIQRVLGLITQARLDIEKTDYASARSNLSEAFSALDEAKELARNYEPVEGSSSGSGEEEDGNETSSSDDASDNSETSKSGEDEKQ